MGVSKAREKHPLRLIEVDLPIKRISAHARREKSIRHGHISTLHIWWARRPLAACRAVICAALWPDPADENCPQSFRDRAAELITAFAQKVMSDKDLAESCSPQSFGRWNALSKPEGRIDPTNLTHLNVLRDALLDFIADFANWDNSTVKEYLETSRALTQAAHEALGGEPGTRPLVVDPFAGGGAIPLEALRVGADAFASDLNPVAVLLNKVVLEYIPKYRNAECRMKNVEGEEVTFKGLAEAVRYWGNWIKEQAEKELAEFYPKDPDGATPIAYLWARTITCEGPGCGAEVPLIKSLWLGKKPHNSWSMRLVPNRKLKRVNVEIIRGANLRNGGEGTVKRGSATCPCCGYTTPAASVRKQLKERRGGTADAKLLCVVTTRPNNRGRFYRVPTKQDIAAIAKARIELERKIVSAGTSDVAPREPTPIGGGSGAGRAFSQRNYGMDSFEDLFTPRQLLTLITLAEQVKAIRTQIDSSYPDGLAEAVQVALALNVDKMADYGSSLASWSSPASQETVRGTFSRQALSIAWDFAEAYPFADSSGGWSHNLDFLISPLDEESRVHATAGTAESANATNHPLPDDSASAFITDPPYYDAIPYADLSDFFIVWLKRSLRGSSLERDFLSLAPKDEECVVDEVKGHDARFFEQTMTKALNEGRRIARPEGIGIVVFAHKSTSGWEAQLQALIDADWAITGSWPIDTERAGRVRANASAALASSVHLVCRPRETPDGSVRADDVGDWREVLAELPRRIHEWMPRLAQEGVVGADAIFACLGPALEIFSRYSRVEKASGEVVTLREYLEQVWATVAREALSMVFEGADAAGFEEDARLTAIWFWVMKEAANGNGKTTSLDSKEDEEESDQSEDEEEKSDQRKKAHGYTMEYDAARKLAQGLGTDLQILSRPGAIISIQGNLATLNSIASREQHLIGVQLSLFNGETAIRHGRPKKGQSGAVTMKPVDVRQASLFAEQPELQSDPDQPLLPSFRSLDKVRPLMERLLESGVTVLDRLHQAMLLFGRGQTALLGPFLQETHMGLNSRFWQLAQALSALYPSGTDEKRWVDGVLARKKGLGF